MNNIRVFCMHSKKIQPQDKECNVEMVTDNCTQIYVYTYSEGKTIHACSYIIIIAIATMKCDNSGTCSLVMSQNYNKNRMQHI